MNLHDRYYEPADDDYEDMEEYIEDYVKFEMRKGGDLDPMEADNFGEAVSQLGLPEELENWEQATQEQKDAIVEYWDGIARHLGEESYFANL